MPRIPKQDVLCEKSSSSSDWRKTRTQSAKRGADNYPGTINGDDGDFGAIERYDRLGWLLSEEERKKVANFSGLCFPCGRCTHDKRRFQTDLPTTNQDVYEGICIKCHQEKMPKNVLRAWEEQNKKNHPEERMCSLRGRNKTRRINQEGKWDDNKVSFD